MQVDSAAEACTSARRFVSVLVALGLCVACFVVVWMLRPASPTGTGSLTVDFAGLTNDSSGAVLVRFKATNAHSRRVSFGIGEVQVLQSNSWPNWMRVAGGSNWLGVAAGSDRVFSIAGSPLSRDTWRVPIMYAEDSSTFDNLRMRVKGIAWVIAHWRPGRPLPSRPYGRKTSFICGPEMVGLAPRLGQGTNTSSSKGTNQTPEEVDHRL